MGWKMMQWQNVHYMPKCTLLVQRTFIFCASVHFVIASFYYTYSNPLPKCTPLFYKSLLYLAMNLWFYRESMYSKMVHCQNVHFRVGIFFFFLSYFTSGLQPLNRKIKFYFNFLGKYGKKDIMGCSLVIL